MSDINNGDMPANPVRGADGVPFNKSDYHGTTNMMSGLTKREIFAMAAMQGTTACDVNNELTVTDIVEQAVYIADALLKELSNVQNG